MRALNLAAVVLWGVLAALTLWNGFDVPWPVKAVLCVIAVYIVAGDLVVRLFGSRNHA